MRLISSLYSGLRQLKEVDLQKINQRQKFSKARQVEFLRYFSTWLFTGSSPVKACSAIINTATDSKTKLDAEAAAAIKQSLEAGGTISAGMKDFFSPEIVLLFEAGSKSDSAALNHILSEYIRIDTQVRQVTSSILGGLKYPLIINAVGLIILLMLGLLILPGFASMVPGGVGGAAAVVMSLAAFISSYGLFLLAGLFGLVFLAVNLMRNATGITRTRLNRYLPLPFALNAALKGMKFLKLFGILLEHQVQPRVALGSIFSMETPFMQAHIHTMQQNLQGRGKTLGAAFQVDLFSVQTLQRLSLALQVEDPEFNKRAVSSVADLAADDVFRSLGNIRLFSQIVAWSFAAILGGLVVSSVIAAFTAIQSIIPM